MKVGDTVRVEIIGDAKSYVEALCDPNEKKTTAELALRNDSIPSGLTLEDLATEANTAHQATGQALGQAILHGIRCGEALLEAHRQVPTRGWKAWCEANLEFKPHYANAYMRLAFHKESLPREIFEPFRNTRGRVMQPSLGRAMNYVRGLPPISGTDNRRTTPDPVKAEAKKLRRQGLTYRAIGSLLGLDHKTVRFICDPEAQRRRLAEQKERSRSLALARKALAEKTRRQERDSLADERGGALGETYSLIRRALQKAESALSQVETRDGREAMRLTMTRLHKAEDAVGKALRSG